MLYYHDGKMRCHQQMIHVMKVLVHKALLPILHDVIIHLLTNIQQSHDRVDMTLVSLTSDYLYLLIEYFKLLWLSMLPIPTPSSFITHLSIRRQLQSFCDINWKILLSLKILRTLEGIHLDENGLLLVLLIEQFLTL
ncbi:unnamed protein product [Rotaria sp. Silwood1]|nr:unnamed protein product [Rotaria sp. Silwood1]CAF4996620.1 unnamed protein product [Rotaria sp. Silwood1]